MATPTPAERARGRRWIAICRAQLRRSTEPSVDEHQAAMGALGKVVGSR